MRCLKSKKENSNIILCKIHRGGIQDVFILRICAKYHGLEYNTQIIAVNRELSRMSIFCKNHVFAHFNSIQGINK